MGVSRMTKEHLGISLALKIHILIVITKIDIAPVTEFDQTKDTLVKILKSPGSQKMPVLVKPEDDISILAASLASDKLTPIFCISNVSGEGVPILKDFLSLLHSRIHSCGHFRKSTDPTS